MPLIVGKDQAPMKLKMVCDGEPKDVAFILRWFQGFLQKFKP